MAFGLEATAVKIKEKNITFKVIPSSKKKELATYVQQIAKLDGELNDSVLAEEKKSGFETISEPAKKMDEKQLLNMYTENSKGVYILALNNNVEVVGCSYVVPGKHKASAHIQWFVIKNDTKKLGVGTLLLVETKKQAKKEKYKHLTLSVGARNATANNLYAKQNFTDIEKLMGVHL